MKNLNEIMDRYVENKLMENAAVRVGRGKDVLYTTFRGGVDEKTLFDMASITKIMATTTLTLMAFDKVFMKPDDPVDKYFKTEKPLTVKHLLTHTMGIGHKPLNIEENTYANIAEKILKIPSDIPVGSDVLYSCPGFILLGKILEKVYGMPLNKCFDELVRRPLSLNYTSFLPSHRQCAVNSNLNEEMRGIVNDYNCRFLGGVAGNAGLFSNITDLTKYVHFLQNRGAPLIEEQTFLSAAQNYTEEMSESRGLGFLYVDERYPQTGGLFAAGAIGHCGHTGQSLFVDYRSGLYVIVLSDATISTTKKYGREHYDEVIDMRTQIHAAIKQDLNEI